MNELDDLLRQIEETARVEDQGPFPYDDVRALRKVFREEFDRLKPGAIFKADLNQFGYTIHGWASGGIRRDLADTGQRYLAKVWLSESFFDKFPVYRFLQGYDLAEYPALYGYTELAERLRRMLLEAIQLYEGRQR